MRSYRWRKSVALVTAGILSACGGGGGGGGGDTAGGEAPEAAVQIDPADGRYDLGYGELWLAMLQP